MAWTAPVTYTVGQVVTAAGLNSDHRDNLKALGDLASASRLNPWPIGALYDGGSFSDLGDATDHSYHLGVGNTAPSFVIDFGSLNAVSGTVQWRGQMVFNIVTIVPGSPSVVSTYPSLVTLGVAGTASAPGGINRIGAGGIQFTNSTGYKAIDSGWATIVASGLNAYAPVRRSDRTGGSGNGTWTNITYFVQVRNQ